METNDFMEISLWDCLHFMADWYVLGIELGFTLWVHDVAVYRIAAFGLVRRNSETLG